MPEEQNPLRQPRDVVGWVLLRDEIAGQRFQGLEIELARVDGDAVSHQPQLELEAQLHAGYVGHGWCFSRVWVHSVMNFCGAGFTVRSSASQWVGFYSAQRRIFKSCLQFHSVHDTCRVACLDSEFTCFNPYRTNHFTDT